MSEMIYTWLLVHIKFCLFLWWMRKLTKNSKSSKPLANRYDSYKPRSKPFNHFPISLVAKQKHFLWYSNVNNSLSNHALTAYLENVKTTFSHLTVIRSVLYQIAANTKEHSGWTWKWKMYMYNSYKIKITWDWLYKTLSCI